MAAGFRVDLSALHQAVSGINDTLDEVLTHDVAAVNCAGAAYGHDDLADVMTDFCDRWQIGLTNLATDVQEVAARLDDNLQAYQQADADVSGMFQGPVDPAATP
jgi:hypothetical protein